MEISVGIYIYIYTNNCVSITYIYIYRERERDRSPFGRKRADEGLHVLGLHLERAEPRLDTLYVCCCYVV